MLHHRDVAVDAVFDMGLLALVNIGEVDFLKFLFVRVHGRSGEGHHTGKHVAGTLPFGRVGVAHELEIGSRRDRGAAVILDVVTHIDDVAAAFEGIRFCYFNVRRLAVGQDNA